MLRVLFAGAEFVIVSKPSGLLSQPGVHAPHAPSVATLLPSCVVVHRLDLATSGLMILPRRASPLALRSIARQFADGGVTKRYEAILDTRALPHDSPLVSTDAGVINEPLGRRPGVPLLHATASAGGLASRAATTAWRVLERAADSSAARVEFLPVTGRTHQLRVHAAHALHAPIVGDALYGPPSGVKEHFSRVLEERRRAGAGDDGADGEGVAAYAAEARERDERVAGMPPPQLVSCPLLTRNGHITPRLLLHARDLVISMPPSVVVAGDAASVSGGEPQLVAWLERAAVEGGAGAGVGVEDCTRHLQHSREGSDLAAFSISESLHPWRKLHFRLATPF